MTAIAVEFEDLFNPATQTALSEQLEDFFNPATQTALAKDLEDLGITIPTIDVPDVPAPAPAPAITPEPGGTPLEPERMSLNDFKILYDDPATRPVVLDARSAESYAGGHIAGSLSFPVFEASTRAGELPRDKLIVAYCQ
jgi:hypothetical protein